jgi:hypothetical protein
MAVFPDFSTVKDTKMCGQSVRNRGNGRAEARFRSGRLIATAIAAIIKAGANKGLRKRM